MSYHFLSTIHVRSDAYFDEDFNNDLCLAGLPDYPVVDLRPAKISSVSDTHSVEDKIIQSV